MKNIKIWILLCIIGTSSIYAQNERFKSLFVYNFTKNIEWPVSYQQKDFIISVLGNSPMYLELKQNVQEKKTGNQVIRISQTVNISSIEKCHILYIPAQQSNLLGAAIHKLAGTPTVIITEKSDLMKNGADINIVQIDGRFQFEINSHQLNNKGLIVSQSLIKLGIISEPGTTKKMPSLDSVDETSIPK